jgi:hypothetical protein
MAKYIKPTLETKFHIDFLWWQSKGHNLKVHLRSHACPECLERYQEEEIFDWVSPETGEVFQIDIAWYCIHTYCSQQTGFIDARTPLTTAIFRTFIANNNAPMTPLEIYEKIQKKSPEMILKTIGGAKVYQRIRPIEMSR